MHKPIIIVTIVAWLGCSPALADEPGPAAPAQQAINNLKDPDPDVRRKAIQELRKLSSRIRRSGGSRIVRPADFDPEEAEQLVRARLANKIADDAAAQAKRAERIGRTLPLAGGPDFAPKVEGLIPHLIEATNDPDEANRVLALHALADTRDPQAQQALRDRLEDDSERIRFEAACLLTEFQDAAGMPVLRAKLDQLSANPDPNPEDDFLYYAHAGKLLAAFERITQKSFGDIPLNPHLLSDSRVVPTAQQDYATLLRRWSAWWAWQPEDEEG